MSEHHFQWRLENDNNVGRRREERTHEEWGSRRCLDFILKLGAAADCKSEHKWPNAFWET